MLDKFNNSRADSNEYVFHNVIGVARININIVGDFMFFMVRFSSIIIRIKDGI